MRIFRLRPAASSALLALATACNSITRGGPCGGGQFAQANATLPDTGLHSGAEVGALMLQHDTQEFTEWHVTQLWAPGASPTVEPSTRVRLVRSDGRILVDTAGLTYKSGVPDGRPGFTVYGLIEDATTRTAWYDGFADDNLWVELWRPTDAIPSVRMRLHTTDREVMPVMHCL